MRRLALAAGWALALAAPASAQDDPAALAIHGNLQTIEIAPVLLAAQESGAQVKMGGITNLVGEPGAPGLSEPGEADLATNAETQLLRQSVNHPELRVIAGVSEGLYRIVARRSAGIGSLSDLKGKRIATIAQTSSGYFLELMLRSAGLSLADVEVRPITPLSGMTEALRNHQVDAVAIWEPEAEKSAQSLGDDLIEFSGDGVYRELFNLNTTTAKLADPATRTRIVKFVHRLIVAAEDLDGYQPGMGQALVIAASGFSPAEVLDSWEHHRFSAELPPDLLDVMEREEQWLAGQAGRAPRTREQLAQLIDTSVYEEALNLGEPVQ